MANRIGLILLMFQPNLCLPIPSSGIDRISFSFYTLFYIFAINRLFIGGRYALSPSFSIEAGYLNQYFNRPVKNLMEHAAVLYLFFRS